MQSFQLYMPIDSPHTMEIMYRWSLVENRSTLFVGVDSLIWRGWEWRRMFNLRGYISTHYDVIQLPGEE